jgi:hypothetical protein
MLDQRVAIPSGERHRLARRPPAIEDGFAGLFELVGGGLSREREGSVFFMPVFPAPIGLI